MIRLLLCLTLLAWLAGCGTDSTEPADTPMTISGMVTDADGNPVANAAILLDLPLVNLDKTVAMPPAMAIQLDLSETGQVRFSLLSACRADTFEHWENEMPGGVHTVVFDGTDRDGRALTDQAIWAVIETPSGITERQILLMRNDGNDGEYGSWDHAFVRDHVRVQATTDADGWFRIADPCVGFGVSVTATNEEGEIVGEVAIGWSVRAWAYHADHPAGAPSNWVDVDPEAGATVSVILDD